MGFLFGNNEEKFDSKRKKEPDGKFKFPVTFHDDIPPIGEIEEKITISAPKMKVKKAKVVELNKKNKDKKGLF